jgi:acetyltransferase
MHLVQYRRNQELLRQVPRTVGDGGRPDRAAARRPIEAALAEGRDWLSEVEAKAVLRAYGIPVVPTEVRGRRPTRRGHRRADHRRCRPPSRSCRPTSPTSPTSAAWRWTWPTRPTVEGSGRARCCAAVARTPPTARTSPGFTVQPMVARPGAFELILGIVDDGTFGPVLLFGQGGVAVEVLDDKALGLPPLDEVLAREMIGRTRVARLLAGFAGARRPTWTASSTRWSRLSATGGRPSRGPRARHQPAARRRRPA